MPAACEGQQGQDLTAARLAELVGGRLEGDPATPVSGISGLAGAGPGDVSFVLEKKYAALAASTQAAVLLVPNQISLEQSGAAALIRVDDLTAALERLSDVFAPPKPKRTPGVHPSAVLGDEVELGDGVYVGPCAVIGDRARIGEGAVISAQVVIGEAVEIGAHTTLHPQVVIGDRCRIGDHVILHPGVKVGGDGFGYVFRGREHHKVPQIGIVVIEDHVEVGCNTSIDRARFGATRIGRGTKIDNQVMIAHNCQVGEHCIITGQCGLAGSATVGDYVVFGAQSGVTGHVHVGDRSQVAGRAGVSKDIPAGSRVMGAPAQPYGDEQRLRALLRRLPELAHTIRSLAGRVNHIVKVLDIEETTKDD
jgi:UDP-3-O-[3-hydroxymyristoyl] glucosamine N-acyltransferase